MNATNTPLRVRCRRLLAAAASVALAAACTTAPAARPADGPPSDLSRLQQTTKRLQLQVDLAASREFYLVFDPAAADLSLMLRGAELQRYPVLSAQIGRPRVSWVRRGEARPWQGVVWTKGTLEPLRQIDRLVVQGAPPGKTEAEAEVKPPPIPPTAEELYPVPSRYLIRFADGLSVEIRPREADASLGRWARIRASWGAKWRDAYAAAFASGEDAVRLRLVLKPKDAESLYRGLPPAVRLLIL
jgi:hypothetical protein